VIGSYSKICLLLTNWYISAKLVRICLCPVYSNGSDVLVGKRRHVITLGSYIKQFFLFLFLLLNFCLLTYSNSYLFNFFCGYYKLTSFTTISPLQCFNFVTLVLRNICIMVVSESGVLGTKLFIKME